MESGRYLLHSPSLFPQKIQLRNSTPLSVWMLYEQTASSIKSFSTTSTTWNFPASALLQEQHVEFRPLLSDDKTLQKTLDWRKTNSGASCEEKKSSEHDSYVKHFEKQLLYASDLCSLFPSLCTGEKLFSSTIMQSKVPDRESLADFKPCDVLALAKKAVVASREAASLAEEYNLSGADSNEFFTGSESTSLAIEAPLEKEIKVRSKRLLERRSRRHRVPKPKAIVHETPSLRKVDIQHKINVGFDQNDPLRLFLSGSETRQLLSAKEERELFVQIKALTRLEEVKVRLQSQFNREPTLVEWADATGMSCSILQSHLHLGNRSREKMACANFRLVVHVAKQYQGRGLNLQDLMQEGSMGLMKSIEKFKPQVGCRFSTYAYWWIRQSIRKAIFQNSRTIRLPENVYSLLRKVKNAKNLYIQEGHHATNEELANRVGITVEKLESLLFSTRMPLSMQQPVWADQNTTFQEITADSGVEIPELYVNKKLMRQHVRNLLSILLPKERRIIRLRFGIEDGEPKSLSQIGSVFGITKERVRQLESRALDKLRKCLLGEGLGAYAELLI